MNKCVLAIAILIVGISGLPNKLSQIVSDEINSDLDAITEIIHEGIEKIKEAGLDPYINDGEEYGVSLDYLLPGEIRIDGHFKNFKFTGLSDIIINGISKEGQLLVLDLSLPRLEAQIDSAITEVSYTGNLRGKIEYSGRLAVNDISFIAQIRKSFFGPTIDDLQLAVGIGSVESNMKLVVEDEDVSVIFNDFLELGLPSLLTDYEEALNKSLSQLVLMIIGRR